MNAAQRVHRIVITSYPTPDGLPFDQQPQNDYETAVELYGNPGAPLDCPDWLEGIDLTERLCTYEYPEPQYATLPGHVILDSGRHALLTVPVLRRVNFFSRAAAVKRLSYLTEWGAIGHIESSDPITWTTP